MTRPFRAMFLIGFEFGRGFPGTVGPRASECGTASSRNQLRRRAPS